MPIYVVGERNQRVSIPNEALAVSITGSVAEAELDVRAGAQQLVVRPTAHRAVLPEIAGEVTVGVRPVGTARFGAGTVVHLEIAHDDPTEVDPVQVLFDPVDVSGESGVVFAALRPHGSHVEVGVIAVADVPLSPLGSAARSSARQLIGAHAGAVRRVGVVALDVSASMRPWFADGSAAAVTDIVVGVAAAAGIRNVSAVFVGAEVTPVGAGGSDARGTDGVGLADAVRKARPRWCAGARWSQLAPGRPHHRLCRLSDFCCPAGLSADHLVRMTAGSTLQGRGCRHRGRATTRRPNCWCTRRYWTASPPFWSGVLGDEVPAVLFGAELRAAPVDGAPASRDHPLFRRGRIGVQWRARRERAVLQVGPAGGLPTGRHRRRPTPAGRCKARWWRCARCVTTRCRTGWHDGHAVCIAMAGARATGKSLYIAVLVKQLQLLCENLGFSMEPATRATATAYSTHYETPLFVQRGLIPPTPTVHTQASLQREPLIFSIGIWHDVRRYLVLRDVAGEDLETGRSERAAVSVLRQRRRRVLHVRSVAGQVDS